MPSTTTLLPALLLVVLSTTCAAAADDGGTSDPLQPYFGTYCLWCHGPEKQEGKFRLDTLSRDFANPEAAQQWGEILFRMNKGEMPPEDEPQPGSGELGQAVDWISARISEGQAARMARRGPVAHYRLSREEFGHTVYDLLGVHYDVTQPGALNEDPRWHGFERIGSMLTLSPSHVDRHFKAAETDHADQRAAPRPKVEPSDQSRLNRDVSLERLGEYLRTMYDIVVLAFQTDLTRVVTFSTGNEGQGPAVPEIGVRQDRHSLSHHNGNAKLMQDLRESDAFNIKQFGYFLDRLAQAQDADGPLLDTTMALYGSGMAYGHSHGNASLPILLAGGSGLGLKHGAHLDFNRTKSFAGYDQQTGVYHNPVNAQAHLSNLLLTMAQKMEVPVERFADSNGTLSELLT